MPQDIAPGATRTFHRVVTPDTFPTFQGQAVHPVYSTYALGQDAEWCCRLFVLDMLLPGEEGIGTFLNIRHHSPALEGQQVEFTATVTRWEKNELDCSWVCRVGQRLVAEGEQGQKILDLARFRAGLERLK